MFIWFILFLSLNFNSFQQQKPDYNCVTFVKINNINVTLDRIESCTKLVRISKEFGYDDDETRVLISLSWSESSWREGVINKKTGCYGILQASPKYFCPNKKTDGCDEYKAGFAAWEEIKRLHPTKCLKTKLCHYKSGNICTNVAKKGALRVYYKQKSLSTAIKRGNRNNG